MGVVVNNKLIDKGQFYKNLLVEMTFKYGYCSIPDRTRIKRPEIKSFISLLTLNFCTKSLRLNNF